MPVFDYRPLMRRMLKHAKEWQARLTGKRFFCSALSGLSGYNIVVNSDMSVSCNCQDFDGTGHIGDLNRNSLAEIFAGPVARAFRKTLAEGRLPLLTCSRCVDLQWATADEAARHIEEFDLPRRGLMIENTVHCNLNCTACARHDVTKTRKRMALTEEEIRRISAIVRDEEIRMVSFFNLGEPFLPPQVNKQLSILRSDNPQLRIIISTNGALLDTDLKRDGALLVDELYFSIDGVTDAMVNKYQVGGSFTKAYRNLCEMVRYRNQRGTTSPHIEWKYVVFNWNDHPSMIRRAIELARAAGVDAISFWPTMNPVWGTSLRYRWGSFFKTVGEATWKGREVRFQSDR